MLHHRTYDGAVEKWLKSMGAAADPAILAGLPDQQEAGDLLQTCVAMLPVDGAGGVSGASGSLHEQQPPLHLSIRSDTGSDALSEFERRE
eukprot:7389831-Prymnesium_polylepis.1